MLIGIIGAPNKGKSTLFYALTLKDVEIADYPFTTINPNIGITYATSICPEKELGTKCKARNSLCVNGTRKIPINIVDVAGLVEGAHLGKGMGNQFLNDLATADALMLVVDASGRTDALGNPCEICNPIDDVKMVKGEVVKWTSSIIIKHMAQLSKRSDGASALEEILNGLRINKEQIISAISAANVSSARISWSEADTDRFAEKLLEISKPILVIANKCDVKDADAAVNALKASLGEKSVIAISAAIELAIRKAEKQGIIEYDPASKDLKIISNNITKEQRDALQYMQQFIKAKGANAQEIINRLVFDILDNVVVYPVEDEGKYTDHFGNVLPDAILMKKGSTALDLAEKIHSDIAKNMLYAIDARSKKRLSKDYVLKSDDVIRIVSAAK